MDGEKTKNQRVNYFKLVSFNYNFTTLLFGAFLCHIFKHIFFFTMVNNGHLVFFKSELFCATTQLFITGRVTRKAQND